MTDSVPSLSPPTSAPTPAEMIRAKLACNPNGKLHGVILHREEWEAVCEVLEGRAAVGDGGHTK